MLACIGPSGMASLRDRDSMARSVVLGVHRRKTEAAVTDGDRGHAVPAADGAVRVPVQLGVVVGVQVNRAGSDNTIRSLKHLTGIAGPELWPTSAILPSLMPMSADSAAPASHRQPSRL